MKIIVFLALLSLPLNALSSPPEQEDLIIPAGITTYTSATLTGMSLIVDEPESPVIAYMSVLAAAISQGLILFSLEEEPVNGWHIGISVSNVILITLDLVIAN